MARSVSAGGNYFGAPTPANVGGSGTIFLRLKPTWSSGDGVQHFLWTYTYAGGFELSCQKFSDNNMYVGWRLSGGDARITVADTGLFTSGVWGNWLVDWDETADLTHLYLDNVLIGTSTSLFTAAVSATAMFVGSGESGISSAAGDIAEWGRWDHVLDASERSALQASGDPQCALSGLAQHVKFIGTDNPEPDEIGTADIGFVGTCPQATHPPINACGSTQTIDLAAINASMVVPTPVVSLAAAEINLGSINASMVAPVPIVSIGTLSMTLGALNALMVAPSPRVAFVTPSGLTITISDSLALG